MPAIKSNTKQNGALFTLFTRQNTFTNLLVDDSTMDIKKTVGEDSKNQSGSGAPILRVTELKRHAGDTVEVDVFHPLTEMPTMDDDPVEGTGEELTSSTMKLKINQGRKAVKSGGKMAQQRTDHQLRAIARNELVGPGGYFSNFTDETTLYHLGGARGDRLTSMSKVPLATHKDFAKQLVNPVVPPTFDRHFYGGNATSLDDIESNDVLTLDTIEDMRLFIDEQDNMQLQPIQFMDEKVMGDPMYVLYVTPRQFRNFKATTSHERWQDLIAQAASREKGFTHQLFRGDRVMWENILIKPMSNHWIEFMAGSTVDVCQNNNAATITQATPGVDVHRGILLGAQALAWAFGNVGSTSGNDKGFIGTTEVKLDHDNQTEIACRWMDGKAKIRFADKNGRVNDNGVMIVDTAVS